MHPPANRCGSPNPHTGLAMPVELRRWPPTTTGGSGRALCLPPQRCAELPAQPLSHSGRSGPCPRGTLAVTRHRKSPHRGAQNRRPVAALYLNGRRRTRGMARPARVRPDPVPPLRRGHDAGLAVRRQLHLLLHGGAGAAALGRAGHAVGRRRVGDAGAGGRRQLHVLRPARARHASRRAEHRFRGRGRAKPKTRPEDKGQFGRDISTEEFKPLYDPTAEGGESRSVAEHGCSSPSRNAEGEEHPQSQEAAAAAPAPPLGSSSGPFRAGRARLLRKPEALRADGGQTSKARTPVASSSLERRVPLVIRSRGCFPRAPAPRRPASRPTVRRAPCACREHRARPRHRAG